jgi:alkylhydroperoxidase family enzyme
MSDISALHAALVMRVLDGNGQAPASLRRAAFNNAGLDSPLRELVDKVVHHAYAVTDQDIAAASAAGLSEDQIFEVVVCAAVGEATRQYESGLAALDSAVVVK